MTNHEATGKRDLKYSAFHRTLSFKCRAINIDFMEIRAGKIVAFMEIAEANPLTKVTDSYFFKFKYYEAKVLKQLSKITGLPAYVVFHNNDLTNFKIFYELPTAKNLVLDKQNYIKWIENITESKPTEYFTDKSPVETKGLDFPDIPDSWEGDTK